MAKTHHPSSSSSSRKKSRKDAKKRKRPRANNSQEDLSNVCNITGLDGAGGLMGDTMMGAISLMENGDNVLDCLEEMATAQVGAAASSLNAGGADSSGDKDASNTRDSLPDAKTSNHPPPPPGIHQIPNIRIELARHLQTQSLSSFLLQSCPGLRMPTFERWLLDSKLEEADRFEFIIEGWMDDPTSKLACAEGKAKKKYGRAAMYKQQDGDANARQEREKSRREHDCKLLVDAEKRMPSKSLSVGNWIRHLRRDPVLPHLCMEADPSSDRLSKEIIAALASGPEEGIDKRQKANDIVRELCHRSSEACKEIQNMEQRLGRYQKFAWDASATDGTGGKKKKRKRGGSGGKGGANAGVVKIEWHDEVVCSLIYVPKKRKPSKSSSAPSSAVPTGGNADDDIAASQHKPKPFVVKVNASHYHKLRAMFDSTYSSANASLSAPSTTSEQSTHAFHAILFATIIRYSSLSGGQQLNDWRGGGMQGAVHEGVFDCLSKRFGGSDRGTECFASPFNSTVSRFFSAFPSPDIDGHFGSHGDFFHPASESAFLRRGWYELNPPFSPGVMDKMAHRVGKLLDASIKEELDVTFVVVIPTVRTGSNLDTKLKAKKGKKKKRQKREHSDDGTETRGESNNTVHQAASQSFHRLIGSPCCRSHIVLPAREHGYIEGGQHLRPTKFKESQYRTSVIILRSESWTGSDAEAFEEEMREAFASRHAMEVEQRRAKSKGGD